MSPRAGETNLPVLLSTLDPTVASDVFVFLTTKKSIDDLPLKSLQPQMLFQESEGTTIITTKALAEAHGYDDYVFTCKKITISVHSSLEAVGMTAAIASEFANHGIASNVVSAYFHDHIFVPLGTEDKALQVLKDMMVKAKSTSFKIA
ncbi:ACT domain-containing protein [Lipomyces orientalis]|uniref:ACT domain-containing protein n=1 Tax=Lipomyces orientalis TaxID=1233043 RepID=A0ACC3TGM7_9ASCO